MIVVVDASVAVKWFIADYPGEVHSDQAMVLLERLNLRDDVAVKPGHWLAEIVAVLVRLAPDRVPVALKLLSVLPFEVETDLKFLGDAAALATRHKAHVFDTLYHAVALARAAVPVKADERYFAVARDEGSIVQLRDLSAL